MKVLNVAEKPSVAKEIANILSSGRSQRRPGFSKYNALFDFPYQIRGQQVQMVVTSVTGHIMELDFDASVRSWHSCDPVELFTAPVNKRIRSDETQKKIEKTLLKEARQSQWLVLWLDCDREGENIAYEVKSICEKSNRRLRVLRARFSALIPRDITHAVQNLVEPNEKLALAVDARSEIDLRIGAAFTRFQTMRIQNKFPALKQEKSVISYGPCQFPTLGFVVERFLKIQNFEQEEFYYISVTHQQNDQPDVPTTTFKWKRGHLFDRMACLCIYECLVESQTATIESVDKRPSWKRKPLPLTTVELQKRASRWLRISSEVTMRAAESLYNKGLISYPRTETSKFKEGTDLMGLVRLHENHQQWGNYVTRQLLDGRYEAPRHGNSDDQAHPPIHPTKSIDVNTLSDPNEKKVYEFVALHFLACCSRDAKGSQTSVLMKILGEAFTASGLMVEERNYLGIYKYEKWNASAIPVYQRGDVFRPSTVVMLCGETNPPPLLSEADLIAKMDSNGIGTDATIAEHIKTILKREYAIKVNNDTQFKPTTLGLALVLSYEHMGLELAKPVLRAAMENDCKAISLGQKNIKQVVRSCMDQMKNIFLEVTRSATVLDQTFSEQFGQLANESSLPPRVNTRPRTPVGREQRSSSDPAAAFQGHSTGISETGQEQRRTHQRPPPRSFGPTQAQTRTPPAPSMSSDIPRCEDHGLPCVEREVSRDGPNKGRMFYVCPLPQGEQCNHFAWVSESNPDDGPVVKCPGHDEPCAVRTVRKEGPNKGRQFYTCRRSQTDNSCGYFQWKDEVTGPSGASTTMRNVGTPSDVPKCSGHDTPCVLRKTRKAGPNQDREFYSCSFQGAESCGYFEWKDEIGSQQQQRPPPSSIPPSGSNVGANTNEAPVCCCGLPGVLLTCKNGANKGRTFFKCPNPQGSQCDFFEWGS